MKLQCSKLLSGLDITGYIYSPNHTYFRDIKLPAAMPAVNLDYSNVTFTFLSLNRVQLSMRLLDSLAMVVPGFSGKILIIDNGSNARSLEQLKIFLNRYPFPVRLEELGGNYGVGGGRNKAAEIIDTDWFISVDNDMILIKDPLLAIKQAVDLLGASFVNIPFLQEDGSLIEACGGNLSIQPYESGYQLTNCSVYQQMPALLVDLQQPFLSTFIFGGASCMNTRQFIEHGCFDNELLVGFEDLEFSLRLYQRGIKIATAPVFSLIHAHDTAISEEDIEYEKIRYFKEPLKASAEYIYRKHGLQVWMPWVEKWVDKMREKVGIELPVTTPVTLERQQILLKEENVSLSSDKCKIAVILDNLNDKFAEFSAPLFEYLSSFYELDLYYADQYDNVAVLLQHVSTYNLIHFINYCTLFSLFSDQVYLYFQQRQWNYTDFLEDFVSRLILTTRISDPSAALGVEAPDLCMLFSVVTSGYAVTSQNVREIIQDSKIHPGPAAVLEEAIDVEFFSPLHLERLADTNRSLVIGWIADDPQVTGSKIELNMLLNELNTQGVLLQGKMLERNVSGFSLERLRDFLNTIDIYLDLGENTQSLLAAMACGLPIIVSSIEIDPALLSPLQSQFMVVDQNPYLMQRCIQRLASQAELRVALSQENLERIRRCDWAAHAADWQAFFDQILHSANAPERAASLELRRMVLRQQARISELRTQVSSLGSQLQEAHVAHQRTLDELMNVWTELVKIKCSRSYRMMVWLRRSPPGRLLASVARRTLALAHSFRR